MTETSTHIEHGLSPESAELIDLAARAILDADGIPATTKILAEMRETPSVIAAVNVIAGRLLADQTSAHTQIAELKATIAQMSAELAEARAKAIKFQNALAAAPGTAPLMQVTACQDPQSLIKARVGESTPTGLPALPDYTGTTR